MSLDLLAQLSSSIADLAESSAASVVRVHGSRRRRASGVAWADGVVVTALHALEHDEGLEVGLPSGETARAELIGGDPSTGLALLRVAAAHLPVPVWADDASARIGQLVVGVSRRGRSARAEVATIARAAGEFRSAHGGRIDRYLETTLDPRRGLSGGLVADA